MLEEKEKEETLRIPVMRRCVNGCRPRLRESVAPPEDGGLSLAQPSGLRPTAEEAGLEQGTLVGNGGEQKKEFVVREWELEQSQMWGPFRPGHPEGVRVLSITSQNPPWRQVGSWASDP